MEIPENVAWKSLKSSIEGTVTKILAEYQNISEDKFDEMVNSITNSQEISLIKKKFFEFYDLSESGRQCIIEHLNEPNFNETKLDSAVYHLSQTKSVDTKIKSLKYLLQYPAVEIISQWEKLSKTLRDCLSNRNNEIAFLSYQLHLKLSLNNFTLKEATFNLLKCLNSIFHSKKIGTHFSSINLKVPFHEQILKLVKLLLNNVKYFFLETNKGIIAEDLINGLLDLVVVHISYEKPDFIHFLCYVYVLDPEAKWFLQLFNLINARKVIMDYFMQNIAFIKYLIKEISVYAMIENEKILEKTLKDDISSNVIKFAAFRHNSNLIACLLSFKIGRKLFPIEIRTKLISEEQIVLLYLEALKVLHGNTHHLHKKPILVDTAKDILIHNSELLYKRNVINAVNVLFKNRDKKSLLDMAKETRFFLDVVNEICQHADAFFVIFGFGCENIVKKHRKVKNQYLKSVSVELPQVMSVFIDKYTDKIEISVGKIITGFALNVIQYQINNYETLERLDDIIYDLIDCCANIHLLHSHAIIILSSQNLIIAIMNLYKILIDRNLALSSMNSLLKFFMVICETKYGASLIIKEDSELFYMICKLCFAITDSHSVNLRSFSMFFINVANTKSGVTAVTECSKQIVTPYLNTIWKLSEDELMLLSGCTESLYNEIFYFLRFVFILHFNFNCVASLLSSETDDDNTITDLDDGAKTLKELIDESLNSSGPSSLSCFLGLYSIRILITNLDTYLHLEYLTRLKNKINNLQMDCLVPDPNNVASSESAVIIDDCSLLRDHILDCVQNLGFIQPVLCKNKNSQSTLCRRISEFQKFLNDTRQCLHDQNWLIQARKLFRQNCDQSFKENTFPDLIQQIKLSFSENNRHNFTWPVNERKFKGDLLPEVYKGIKVIVGFGKRYKLLIHPVYYEDLLISLIKQVQIFLQLAPERFEGFDWFTGVIFLMCGGHVERSKTALNCVSQLPIGPYIWPVFGKQLGLAHNFNYSIHFDQALNLLSSDLEMFKPALEHAGISWNAIVRNWMNQSFFNVLKWEEVYNFVVMAVLFPPEYILFFLICGAQHLESQFLHTITSNEINAFFDILHLKGFFIKDYIDALDQLGKQYKNIFTIPEYTLS